MPHLTRYYMYRQLGLFFKGRISGKILGISGIEGFHPFIDKNAEITDDRFPGIDMQDLPYKDNTFDYVISDQVLEHLDDPAKAVRESHRVLKKGGIGIHTTCFINPVHEAPKDLWRFSPEGLRIICKDFPEILMCEGWGNRVAILLCFVSNRFRLMNIPESKYSLRHLIATINEESYPIATWIIARK
ncbi:MAG: class I SAM-dependent methyltransferase [Deltaproteobacteria bacterium]|nr:class I SAM-dependent methyltransferase [Deltaproteobacteria bacterium]